METSTFLSNDPAVLKQVIQELLEQLQATRRSEELLRHKVDELLRKLFGRKSETVDPNQLLLIDLEALGVPAEAAEPVAVLPEVEPERPRRRPKRRRPSKELPRRRVEHTLPEEERLCPCCEVPMAPMREEIHEQLDYQPSTLEVVEHVRFVYGCSKGCDEKVLTAPKPPQLIEKGLPGPGLLAHVVTCKYADHAPLHRMEGVFRRQGATIPRSTMYGRVAGASDAVEPVVEYLREDVLRSFVLATDDTPVRVQPPRGEGYKGRLWVYHGDEEHPWLVFDYTPTRERAGPERFLAGFQGYLQADAYSGYDQIYAQSDGSILELACWMHCRRYFFEAAQQDPARPCEALALIRQLYKIERDAKGLTPEQRHEQRQERAVPVIEAFEAWTQEQALVTLPKSPMGRALTYTQNQWAALCRYVEDGRLPIDNGRSERALRQVAIGRKNWLFAGSDAGGQRAANLYTLIGTCRFHHLDPFHYLRDLFDRLPTHPASRIAELTPLAWAAEMAERRLAAAS
jgi:transposase